MLERLQGRWPWVVGVGVILGLPNDALGILELPERWAKVSQGLEALGLWNNPELVRYGIAALFLAAFIVPNPWSRKHLPRVSLTDADVVHFPTPRNPNTLHFYALAGFRNLPADPSNERTKAMSVVAYVTLCDEDRNPIRPMMVGRWAHTKDAIQGGTEFENRASDIPSDGTPRFLDLIVKYEDEANCYGWNDRTDRKIDAPGRRDPEHALPPGLYTVKIRLYGPNLDQTFWLTLGNPGKGLSIRLEPG